MMYVSDLKPVEVFYLSQYIICIFSIVNYAFLFIGNVILNYIIYCSFEIIEENTQTRSAGWHNKMIFSYSVLNIEWKRIIELTVDIFCILTIISLFLPSKISFHSLTLYITRVESPNKNMNTLFNSWGEISTNVFSFFIRFVVAEPFFIKLRRSIWLISCIPQIL